MEPDSPVRFTCRQATLNNLPIFGPFVQASRCSHSVSVPVTNLPASVDEGRSCLEPIAEPQGLGSDSSGLSSPEPYRGSGTSPSSVGSKIPSPLSLPSLVSPPVHDAFARNSSSPISINSAPDYIASPHSPSIYHHLSVPLNKEHICRNYDWLLKSDTSFFKVLFPDDIIVELPMKHPIPQSPSVMSVESSSSRKYAPNMLPGNPCLLTIMRWEQDSLCFFNRWETKPGNQVKLVLGSFAQNSKGLDWVNRHSARWLALLDDEDGPGFTFAEFMTEMRTDFLPVNWAHEILTKVIYSKMGDSESFSLYCDHILASNNLVVNTTSHRSDILLHELLMMNSSPSLRNAYDDLAVSEHDCIARIDNFNKWMRAMEAVDKSMTTQMQDVLGRAEAQAKCLINDATSNSDYKRQQTSYVPAVGATSFAPPSHNQFASGANVYPSHNQNVNPNPGYAQSVRNYCPRLMDPECDVLRIRLTTSQGNLRILT